MGEEDGIVAKGDGAEGRAGKIQRRGGNAKKTG